MIICVCNNIDESVIEAYKKQYPTNWFAMLVCQKGLGKECRSCVKFIKKGKYYGP